ncbi:MAG: heat-inducible transcriptional repressor HrcA [Pseudomonadota bacterium]
MDDQTRNPDFELAEREQEIFRRVVDAYIETGEPLGSRSLSRQLTESLSAASVRNVMADLEHLGLIFAPHTSAGRLPTEAGLRFFVDSFMEFGAPDTSDRREIETQLDRAASSPSLDTMLTEASDFLSGVAGGAGLVLVGKRDVRVRHVEFVLLEKTRALGILVGDDGSVENRVLDLAPGTTASQLTAAANWLNAHVAGRTLSEAQKAIAALREQTRAELDTLAAALVDKGLATWVKGDDDAPGSGQPSAGQLIVRGRSRLLEDVRASKDLERARLLFDDLETKNDILSLLNQAEEGEGVRIFIGSENKLFSLSGSSVVVAPYKDADQNIVGAVGVIGPTRLNYRRIVPVVDYTAQTLSRLLQTRLGSARG